MTGLDHVDLVVSDLQRSLGFYRGLLGPLGWSVVSEVPGERAETIHYLGGEGRDRPTSIGLRERQSDAHRVPYDRYAVGVHHLAFWVPSRDLVEERHDWALSQGAEIETPPREYDYSPGYYAFFLYDPDGIKLEVLTKPSRS